MTSKVKNKAPIRRVNKKITVKVKEAKGEGSPPYSLIIAFNLCSYLGIFGAHRFYTGRYISGIFQLITLGGFIIWVVVDWFMLLKENFKDHEDKKLVWPKDREGQFAGFWIRFAAYAIDGAIVGVIGLIITFVFVVLAGAQAIIFNDLIILLVGLVYFVKTTASKYQATIGKRVVGIYVVREDGERVTFARSIGRYFSYIISNMTLGFGYLMVGFTKKKTALHDLVARTYVLYGKPKGEKK